MLISPEGCSAILFKDAARAPEAAASLKITASDLKDLGIADEIIPEPLGGADKNPVESASSIKEALKKNLRLLAGIPGHKLPDLRYKKYRAIGKFKKSRSAAVGSARRKRSSYSDG